MDNGKVKKITITVLILTIFIMSVAYASLYQVLRINGNASVIASWKVEITGIKEGNKTGSAFSGNIPTYTSSTATFDAKLLDVNDSIEYIVTIKNNGRIDAKLSSIMSSRDGDDAIVYEVTGVSENDVLASGDEVNITIKVKVNSSLENIEGNLNSNITIIFNYVQNM